jgi:hypothetical protein
MAVKTFGHELQHIVDLESMGMTSEYWMPDNSEHPMFELEYKFYAEVMGRLAARPSGGHPLMDPRALSIFSKGRIIPPPLCRQ